MNIKAMVILTVCSIALTSFVIVSEGSEDADLPEHDRLYEAVNATYCTNSSTVSFYLSDHGGEYDRRCQWNIIVFENFRYRNVRSRNSERSCTLPDTECRISCRSPSDFHIQDRNASNLRNHRL